MTEVIVDQLERPGSYRRVISSHLSGMAIDIGVTDLTAEDRATLKRLINALPEAGFKDETWREAFRELAQHASCFLLEVGGESSNLRWELHYLRQSNLHDRLVVVAGHPTQATREPNT